MTSSTTSGKGVKKSDEAISGLKKISGPRNLSKPTSTEYAYCYIQLHFVVFFDRIESLLFVLHYEQIQHV